MATQSASHYLRTVTHSFTHSHDVGGVNHGSLSVAVGIRCLAQGHLDPLIGARDGTSNLPVTSKPQLYLQARSKDLTITVSHTGNKSAGSIHTFID
jgi:hypothetical protein